MVGGNSLLERTNVAYRMASDTRQEANKHRQDDVRLTVEDDLYRRGTIAIRLGVGE